MTETEDRLHLLLVDDDEVDRMAVCRALRLGQVEADIIEARDLAEAKRVLRSRPVDCVLLDFALPDGDGFDLLGALRQAKVDTTVIMLTGQGDEALAVDLIKSGASDYLPKHLLSPGRLSQSIRGVLRLRDAERREQRARAALERQASQLQELAQASVRIHETFAEEQILELVTREARDLIGAHIAVARLRGDDGLDEPVTRISVSTKYDPGDLHDIPGAVALDALLRRAKKPLHLTDEQMKEHPELAELGSTPPLRGVLGAPLLGREGRPLGSLLLSDRVNGDFAASDGAMLAHLAQTAAVALENARLYRAAQEATRRRDDVLAIVSHDLRNPLNTISMSAELLHMNAAEDAESGARDLPIVQRIERDVAWMNRLIEDLLDASRIDNGKLSVAPRPERGASLVKDALESAAPLAEAKGSELRLGPVDEALEVMADRTRILQLFSNLVGNSLKFTPRGGAITLTLSRHGKRACFSVEDNGPGIAPEHLDHLFKQYWKGTASSREGAGLGLFIAHGIVVAHGGEIRVESHVGRGTTVRFWLPLTPSARLTPPT